MFDQDVRGPFGDSLPRLDRWTVNPATRRVNEQVVDARAQEFPRCHPGLNGKPYRFGYTVAVKDYGFPSIYKHDMKTGAATQFDVGPGRHSAEPVFVPREGAKAEDDGYLITYVYDQARNASDLIVLDARDLSRPALAQVRLPVRVPYGFHGNWVPDTVTQPALNNRAQNGRLPFPRPERAMQRFRRLKTLQRFVSAWRRKPPSTPRPHIGVESADRLALEMNIIHPSPLASGLYVGAPRVVGAR
eukprot:gene11479-15345_t